MRLLYVFKRWGALGIPQYFLQYAHILSFSKAIPLRNKRQYRVYISVIQIFVKNTEGSKKRQRGISAGRSELVSG